MWSHRYKFKYSRLDFGITFTEQVSFQYDHKTMTNSLRRSCFGSEFHPVGSATLNALLEPYCSDVH